jgi:hypothetical protein
MVPNVLSGFCRVSMIAMRNVLVGICGQSHDMGLVSQVDAIVVSV